MPYPKIRIYVDGNYYGSTIHAQSLNEAIGLFLNKGRARVRRSITAVFASNDTHPDRPRTSS